MHEKILLDEGTEVSETVITEAGILMASQLATLLVCPAYSQLPYSQAVLTTYFILTTISLPRGAEKMRKVKKLKKFC
jgi:hypothetical protein